MTTQTYPVDYVLAHKYCELTGDTEDAIAARRKTGKWLDGKECKVVDRRLYINVSNAQKWIESWQPTKQCGV